MPEQDKPWWQSQTIVTALVNLLTKLGAGAMIAYGVIDIGNPAAEQAMIMLLALFGLGDGAAIRGRARAQQRIRSGVFPEVRGG